ncbi:hypothetical protein PAMA_017097 [Pampus argenteus]
MLKGRKKKQDSYPGEDDSDDRCATLADACEANANVASSPSPATLEDILVAIKTLDSRVDTRFTELNRVIADFKVALTEVSERVSSTEAATNCRARAIIARLHYYQVKELVLRLAREKAPLQYDGRPVYIFPDFTSATMKKCQAFRAIQEKCRAKSIRCGFRHSARFVVTDKNNTSTFTTLAEAEEFLSREADGWDANASVSPRRETE